MRSTFDEPAYLAEPQISTRHVVASLTQNAKAGAPALISRHQSSLSGIKTNRTDLILR